MTRPDEIAALADELENFEEVVLRTDDGPEWSDKRSLSDDEKEMIIAALRLSATSGDAVREDDPKWSLIYWKQFRTIIKVPASLKDEMRAALAPAEKATSDRHPVLHEFMPLSLVPLENPNHDPGEHQVMDSDTAYIFRIGGSRERAENIVACLNAYAATPTPPSADVEEESDDLFAEIESLIADRSADRAADAILRVFKLTRIQSAAHGGGTEGGEV